MRRSHWHRGGVGALASICFVEVCVGAEHPALPIVGLSVPKPARRGVACAQGWRNRRHQGHWGPGRQAARLRCNTVCIKLLLITVSFHIMVLLIDDISECFSVSSHAIRWGYRSICLLCWQMLDAFGSIYGCSSMWSDIFESVWLTLRLDNEPARLGSARTGSLG
jgi:hypothetical protein